MSNFLFLARVNQSLPHLQICEFWSLRWRFDCTVNYWWHTTNSCLCLMTWWCAWFCCNHSATCAMYLYPQWERLHLWSNIVPPEHLLLYTRKPPNWYGSWHSLLGSFTFVGAIETVLDEPPHLWSCNDVNQPNSIGWWPCKVSLIHGLRMLNGNLALPSSKKAIKSKWAF